MSSRSAATAIVSAVMLSAVIVVALPGGLVAALDAASDLRTGWGPDQQAPREPPLPCAPIASRLAEPLIVPSGGQVDVTVELSYTCRTERLPVQFFMLVENTDKTQPSGRTGRRLIANIREGLTNFVGQMNYDAGSEGGFILYNSNETVRMELAGGDEGRRDITNQIENFPTGSNRSARAAGEAVDAAVERLVAAQAASNTLKVILLLDAGAPMTNAKVDINEACQRAKDAGIHMAVFGLESSLGRLMECADPISYRGSGREAGQDIPEEMERFGDGFARRDQAERLLLADTLSHEFEYIEGSGVPEEPVHFLRELSWELVPPAPPEGHEYKYSVRVSEAAMNEIIPLSEQAGLTLFYRDSSFGEVSLEVPDICVHVPGRPEFCDSFAATLTPPAPTDTPTSTPTETQVGPTETATPTVTTEPDRVEIYLPVTAKTEVLRSE